jgi:hypothetical protein
VDSLSSATADNYKVDRGSVMENSHAKVTVLKVCMFRD